MAYSTLNKKRCKCGCGKFPKLGYNGYAYSCAPEDVKEKAGSKMQLARKKKNARVSAAAKVRKEQSVKNKESELELWFLQGMNTCQPVCENCGASKPDLHNPLLKSRWRSCQAHLLPKRHFKSIMTHPLNRMILGSGFSGMCYCHDNYDHDWERASKMNIWPEVVRRFKILYPLIAPEEHQFIPQILLDTL